MAKLFFSRYSLIHGIPGNKLEILLEGFADAVSIKQKGFAYSFFDATPFKYKRQDFIFGHLVKYDPEDQEEIVDERDRKLRKAKLPNKVLGKARFIVYPAGSMLMFCEVPRHITPNTFINVACKLFEENHGNFFTSFDIALIKERYSFIEKVKKYRAIHKVVITLFPSNPSSSKLWEDVDARLIRLHIDRYKEVQENKTDGNIQIDEVTESKFLMSEDGYGNSKVSGLDENGDAKTISTDDNEKAVFQVVTPTDGEPPSSLLEMIYDRLTGIIKRTKE